MKTFYFKTLIFQTVFYGLFALMCYYEDPKEEDFLWVPFIGIFYGVSSLSTFVIPMYKELFRKKTTESK
jgi:hypothetical protein